LPNGAFRKLSAAADPESLAPLPSDIPILEGYDLTEEASPEEIPTGDGGASIEESLKRNRVPELRVSDPDRLLAGAEAPLK
jgi:hypothetical protein